MEVFGIEHDLVSVVLSVSNVEMQLSRKSIFGIIFFSWAMSQEES